MSAAVGWRLGGGWMGVVVVGVTSKSHGDAELKPNPKQIDPGGMCCIPPWIRSRYSATSDPNPSHPNRAPQPARAFTPTYSPRCHQGWRGLWAAVLTACVHAGVCVLVFLCGCV